MWELLEMLIEGAIDLVSELLEEGGGIAAPVPVPAEPAATAAPADTVISAGSSMAARIDDGISPARFDPPPPAEPYTP
jgi:hypothetical protein